MFKEIGFELGNLQIENERLKQENEVLKKVLDEIEEMLKEITKEDICVDCSFYETQERCYECDYEGHRQELYYKRTKYNLALEILQKIKEVKENE